MDEFLRPLLAKGLARRQSEDRPLFHSPIFDGSTLPLEENLRLSSELLDACATAGVVLEVECGVVGDEEDGVGETGVSAERLYTRTEDLLRVAEVLGTRTVRPLPTRRPRSATSMASTSPERSSCVRRSSGRAKRRSPLRVPERGSTMSSTEERLDR